LAIDRRRKMKSIISKLLNSKKVWVLLIGILVVILNRVLELGLTGADLEKIAGADIAALLGLGMADWNKEAAKELRAAAETKAKLDAGELPEANPT
jgi:hypothetical protein